MGNNGTYDDNDVITSHVPLRNLAFFLSCSLEQLVLHMLQISSVLFSLLTALSASLGSLEELGGAFVLRSVLQDRRAAITFCPQKRRG